MSKYYITMGQTHVHRIDGVTIDADSVAVIEAPTHFEAREIAMELFGKKFCTSYDNLDDVSMDYYPRGLIEVN